MEQEQPQSQSSQPTQPSQRIERVFVVSTYNTIEIGEKEVVRVVTPYAGPYFYNCLNLGPCTVFYRDDRDPSPHDPHSMTLPPLTADNLVLIPSGPEGLRFKAGPPCSALAGPSEFLDEHPRTRITMRLVRG